MADRLKSYRIARRITGWLLLATALSTPSLSQATDTEFSTEPSWQLANPDVVYRQLENYVRSLQLAPDQSSKIRDLWWQADAAVNNQPAGLLDRLAFCLAVADDRVSQLVAFCSKTERLTTLPDFSWLAHSETSPLVRFNMRLYYARWLVQNGYDDEAIAWTDGLMPGDVVAPETLLFYRAVASHRLVNADRADATVAELLQRSEELPTRYQKLAALMQRDLAGLEDESLDHIARRMADVRRRLELGRAGKTVQVVEDGVVASLDKMIKDLEDQAQKQQSQSSSSGGAPSSTPMQDSRLAELKAAGKVDQRDIGHGADWGDMPDKDREQALQDVGREFPSHYREVIEEYFRRLAAEESDNALSRLAEILSVESGLGRRGSSHSRESQPVWNLIAVLALAVGSPANVTATKLDGTAAAGRLQNWSASEIALATTEGQKFLPTAELLTLEFSAQSTGDTGKPLVELTDGSVLPLASYTASGNQAVAQLQLPAPAEPQPVSVPLERVHSVRLQALAADVLPQWQEICKLGVPGDLIVVSKRGGKSLDHLECVLGEITDTEVAFELDGKEMRVPRSKVAGLIYYRSDDTAATPACVLVGSDGLRIAATAVRLEGDHLIADTVAGVPLAWPRSDIASADLSAGKVVFLSDVKPATAMWQPLVSLPTAASRAAQFGQPRFNRSANGGPLTLAVPDADPAISRGQVKSFAKGLAIRSRSELVYRLPAGYSRFLAEAGIDPAAAASGNVMLSLFGDDRLLMEQPIDGSDGPVPLDLNVTGVKRLKIVVDYGENLDTGDWLNLGNARIVK